jgi:hypothetical protein
VIRVFSKHRGNKMDFVRLLSIEILKQYDGSDPETFIMDFLTPKKRCCAITIKGDQCTKYTRDTLCTVHLKAKQKPKKEPKKQKDKKVVRVHTHAPGEECELCKLHGDIFTVPEYEIF